MYKLETTEDISFMLFHEAMDAFEHAVSRGTDTDITDTARRLAIAVKEVKVNHAGDAIARLLRNRRHAAWVFEQVALSVLNIDANVDVTIFVDNFIPNYLLPFLSSDADVTEDDDSLLFRKAVSDDDKTLILTVVVGKEMAKTLPPPASMPTPIIIDVVMGAINQGIPGGFLRLDVTPRSRMLESLRPFASNLFYRSDPNDYAHFVTATKGFSSITITVPISDLSIMREMARRGSSCSIQ